MRRKEKDKENVRDRAKGFVKKLIGTIQIICSNEPPVSNGTSSNSIATPCITPAQAEPGLEPPSGGSSPAQGNQTPLQLGLWEQAVEDLESSDRKKVENLIKYEQKVPGIHDRDSLTDKVDYVLERAKKLGDEAKEETARPVSSFRSKSTIEEVLNKLTGPRLLRRLFKGP